MSKLGFVLLYTRDVPATIAFYEKAFAVERAYIAENKAYGQLKGDIPLAFVQEDFARQSAGAFTPTRPDAPPPAVEIGFVVDDVDAAYKRAVDAGCAPVLAPVDKPWGQRVSYVRDHDGVLVEICTPWSV
jgi:catechol 2,3-dioxygenase-like lactoylglutathione lyase family enzyme